MNPKSTPRAAVKSATNSETPTHTKAFVAVALRGGEAVATAVSGSVKGAVMEVMADPEFNYVGDHILFGYLVEEVAVSFSSGEKVWPS